MPDAGREVRRIGRLLKQPAISAICSCSGSAKRISSESSTWKSAICGDSKPDINSRQHPIDRDHRYRQRMRIAIVLVGVFIALAGLLFTLQGVGAVSGSPMSNTTTWSILGPIIALIGVGLAVASWRRRS